MRLCIRVILAAAVWLMITPNLFAATVADRVSGYILLQVQQSGQAWYVAPTTGLRYYLGRPDDALSIMRRLGQGITNANLAKIPVAGSAETGDMTLRQRLAGHILLQVERNGEAWYIYPKNQTRYYLGRPTDALAVMRQLGLGISDADLNQILADVGITLKQTQIATTRGTFTVDLMSFDRSNPNLKIMTDTAQSTNCLTDCTVFPLSTYVSRRNAVAGMHGTYFCPTEYAGCAGQTNFYFYPVYNSFTGTFVHIDRLKYTTEPIILFDTSNRPFMFRPASTNRNEANLRESLAVDSLSQGGTGVLQAGFSNGPGLVAGGKNIVGEYALDTKQSTVKTYRGALGWKGDIISLMIVRGATVADSAAVMMTLSLEYAINLDGGGSTAMMLGQKYIVGPGRALPNAILVTPR